MSWSNRMLAAAISLLVLTACGSERADDASAAGGAPATGGGEVASEQAVRACDLLDLAAATRIIGSGTEHPGGDTEALTCIYSNPGVAMLTIQLGGAQLYDQITIMPPHTSVEIGTKGRHNVQENGATAVQFAKGAHSVTMSVQPIGTAEATYLDPLLTEARAVADRLP